MKNIISFLILFNLYYCCFCFKIKLALNNNIELKKNNIDRIVYAKYLKDIRKTQKFISKSTETLNRYGNISNDIYENKKTIYNNTDLKLKQIIIDNKIYINIENIKIINIISEKGELKIELDKKISNNIDIYENIKDIDKLINIINLLLYFNNK
tara:strand:+ start:362 stop:823 length:462 start_codon:yes stop_codon:yes gene_type:complete